MKKTDAILNDMTVGDPVKLILRFAVPLFIGNIFQQIYSVVDTMIAGYNLGDMAIAAIGATGSLYALLVDFASGLNNGYGIVVAQEFGAKDEDRLRRSIATMIVLNISITALVSILAVIFLKPLMRLMNVPESIFTDAYSYIGIILGGMTVTIAYNMFAGIMRAVGNSKTPLYFLIISCAVNIALDLLFIVSLNLGVAGAAAATVIAQGVSAVLSGIYVFRKYKDILPKREDFRLEAKLTYKMASTGFAMALALCIVDIGSVIYQRAVNELGEILIVAHTAVRKLISMLIMPLGSIAMAFSTFTSQNWGAGKAERIQNTLKKVVTMEIGMGLFVCALIFIFGDAIVRLLTGTSDSEVVANAVLSLRIHFACYPALGVLLALRSTMQSIGQKAIPVASSAFELGIKIVSGLWLIPAFGYICVCLTEPVIWTVCAVYLIIVYCVQKPFSVKRPEQTQSD